MAEAQARGTPRGSTRAELHKPLVLRTMKAEAIYRRDTRNLERAERDRYSSFLWNVVRLDLGPRVTLADLVEEAGSRAPADRQEDDLAKSLDFYARKDPERLLPVLKFFSAYLLQKAREATDSRRQLFLAFKGIDLLRMIVQYSPYSVSLEAESIVAGLLADLNGQLPQRFGRYNETEIRVLATMQVLQHASNDHGARAQLADAYVRQTSHYDALVQYQVLLRLLPAMRLELDRRRGLVHVRIGDLFQGLADMNLVGLQDGRKLRNFVERYTRDHEDGKELLPAVFGSDPNSLRRLQTGFRMLATRSYLRAVKVRDLEPHVLLSVYTRLGRNLIAAGKYKEAASALTEGNRHYKPKQETLAMLDQRVAYLELLADAAHRARRKDLFDQVQVQMTEVKKRHRDLRSANVERQRRRADLLGVEGE
jgi:tetratricopeptide (TPR) repeat protein